MGAQPWGVVTSHKNFFLFLTQNVKLIYFSYVLHIYSNTFVCACQDNLLYGLTLVIESVKCIFILHPLNVNNV